MQLDAIIICGYLTVYSEDTGYCDAFGDIEQSKSV